MTEDEAFHRLRRLLIEVNAEQPLLQPDYRPLSDIIDHDGLKPPPEGAYARLTPLGWGPSGDGWLRCFDTITVGGCERVVEIKTEGGAWGWRVDVYAGRAGDIARTLRGSLKTSRAELDLLPLVVGTVSDIRENWVREEEQLTGHATFTVSLRTKRETRVLIDVFERGHIDLVSGDGTSKTSIDYAKE